MLHEFLNERKIPPLKSREEMLNILQKEEYGFLPKAPDSVTYTEDTAYQPQWNEACSIGLIKMKKVDICCKYETKEFTFPVYVSQSKTGEKKRPLMINCGHRKHVGDILLPTELVAASGFDVISFCYTDVTSDDNDFTGGLAGILYDGGERTDTDAGKISMWAWAAHRALDYAETQDKLDMNCAIVCGHSRLGKTALLAGATDERFKYVHSNDSGACGAALSRGKIGERQSVMARVLRWYCNNFSKYKNEENAAEFDQHYLLAAIAPRYVYVASAYEDTWADPDSEFLSCVAASEAFEKYGKKGLICEDRLPEIGDEYHEGTIGYHLRSGIHYFGRTDWMKLIKFIIKHEKGEGLWKK